MHGSVRSEVEQCVLVLRRCLGSFLSRVFDQSERPSPDVDLPARKRPTLPPGWCALLQRQSAVPSAPQPLFSALWFLPLHRLVSEEQSFCVRPRILSGLAYAL